MENRTYLIEIKDGLVISKKLDSRYKQVDLAYEEISNLESEGNESLGGIISRIEKFNEQYKAPNGNPKTDRSEE